MSMDRVDQLLHDADRKVGGSGMASMMGDRRVAAEMEREAVALYREALAADPTRQSWAWRESGNQEDDWLTSHGLTAVIEARNGPLAPVSDPPAQEGT